MFFKYELIIIISNKQIQIHKIKNERNLMIIKENRVLVLAAKKIEKIDTIPILKILLTVTQSLQLLIMAIGNVLNVVTGIGPEENSVIGVNLKKMKNAKLE